MKRYVVLAAALSVLVIGVPMAAADLSAPTITSDPPSPANNNAPTLTVSTAPLAVVTVYSDSGCTGSVLGTGSAGPDGNYALQVSVPSDAPTTFSASAFDGTSTSPCTDFTYVEDSTAPAQPAINSHPDVLTTAQSAAFTFSDTAADVASYSCTLDAGAPTDCSSGSASYPSLADGAHTFSVTAADAAGNVSEAAPFQWTVDTTPPPPPLIDEEPTDPSALTTATFVFHDTSGDATTFICSIDNGTFSACLPSGVTYTGLSDGHHTFAVEGVDALGNTGSASTYDWTVDTVHPLVAISDKPPLLTNQTSANFSFSSSPAADHYECALDAASFATCTSPQHYEGLADGSHTFSVRSVSSGGTRSAATSYTWTIDTVPPETTIASGPPASGHSASAAFTFTSSESGSTFFCSINSSGFAPCSSPQTYSGLGDGTYTFRVQATDAAGNADPSAATYTWTISGVGPPVADLRPPANVSRLRRSVGYGRLQLRWLKPRDADFDHVGVYVSTSPKTPPRKLLYTGKAQTYTDRHFKNGQYYRYLVVSYDHAKNASGGKPALVPPSALLVAPRPGSAIRTAPTFRWAGIRGAAFYNIQLWKNGEKVLSMWPGRARQVLSRRWSYRGRRHSLSHGVYVWYVWPGFGPRTKARYGQLLGYASFRVR